ncbi:ZIP family metal transporter [Candidatus Woesearchaeota archaeon]|nr:ZIP family metal transporter [Candidatus Woesearchaeota archaeon]
MNVLYPLLATISVSLISVLVAIPFLVKKSISKKVLLFLLSLSVGVLLSTVFINFLPEAISDKYTLGLAIYVLLGFFMMFVIEKFVHAHHDKKCERNASGHSHAYNLAPINLIGDGIHNFLDGLVIAGSFAFNASVGIAATISILFHEIPQEIADFGVLLYSGMSKKKALLFNFLSALSAILGTVVGIFLVTKLEGFTQFILPFAAGNFLYIASANLLPELHRHCKLKDTFIHLLAIFAGICIIILITLFGPGHIH